jgi:hypothetical protein
MLKMFLGHIYHEVLNRCHRRNRGNNRKRAQPCEEKVWQIRDDKRGRREREQCERIG